MTAKYLPPLSVRSDGAPWKRITPPFVAQQRYSPAEWIAWALGNLGGLIEGQFTLADRAGDRAPRDFSGVVVLGDHIDGLGRTGRPPIPERIMRAWRENPVGEIMWLTPTGIAVAFIFPAPENGLALMRTANPIRIMDRWLHDRVVRREQYAPGKFRGGYVVRDDVDPTHPTYLPRARVNGELRSTPICLARDVKLSTPEQLIRRSAKIEAAPPVESPRADRAKSSGVLGKMGTFLRIGGA